MNQLTLNAIALGVFAMTLSVLLGPLVNLSPSLSAGLIFLGLTAVTFDSVRFQSLGLTLLLDTVAQRLPRYRDRILHHEAGHFFAATHLGLPIESYSLSVWEAWKQGNIHQAGVVLNQPTDGTLPDWMRTHIETLCTVWMAGGVAETLKYKTTQGNEDDLRQLRQTLTQLGLNITMYEQQANRRARQLLQDNWQSYEALVCTMALRQPVAECCRVVKPLQPSVSRN